MDIAFVALLAASVEAVPSVTMSSTLSRPISCVPGARRANVRNYSQTLLDRYAFFHRRMTSVYVFTYINLSTFVISHLCFLHHLW